MNTMSLPRIERMTLVLLAVAILGTLIWSKNISTLLGVALGGAFAGINFYGLRRLLQGIIHSTAVRRQAIISVLLMCKFGLAAITLYLVFKYCKVSALAFIMGFSTLVVAIFIEGFRAILTETVTPSE